MSPAHARHTSSHQENLLKVCAICVKKIISKRKVEINNQDLQRIKQHLSSNFNLQSEKFPKSLCATCRRKLLDKSKGKDVELPNIIDFETTVKLQNTRSNKSKLCLCTLCKIGRGKKNKESKKIQQNVIQICKICKSEVSKGKQHDCKETNIVRNILILTENIDKKIIEQIVSSFIDRLNEKGEDQIKLTTKGKPKSILVNPKEQKTAVFLSEDFMKLKTKLNMSHNNINNVAQWVRKIQGKFVV